MTGGARRHFFLQVEPARHRHARAAADSTSEVFGVEAQYSWDLAADVNGDAAQPRARRLLTHHVYAEVPPRVEYALTPLGKQFMQPVRGLVTWLQTHWSTIRAAREKF